MAQVADRVTTPLRAVVWRHFLPTLAERGALRSGDPRHPRGVHRAFDDVDQDVVGRHTGRSQTLRKGLGEAQKLGGPWRDY